MNIRWLDELIHLREVAVVHVLSLVILVPFPSLIVLVWALDI